MSQTLYHGWYSAKADKLSGHSIWLDMKNQEVKVTVISPTDDHGCKWDDIIYVGKLRRQIAVNIQPESFTESFIKDDPLFNDISYT